jgi:DNA-binding response OmpR family regulator
MQSHIVLQSLNLLFIDDDIHVKKDAYSLFSPMFKSVILAHDASSAMHYYNTSQIDIIIIDIQISAEDGLTFIDNIREENYDIPIIVLSALSERKHLLRAANLRVDGYFVKPLAFQELNPIFERIGQQLEHKLSIYHIAENIRYCFLTCSLIIDLKLTSLGKKERLLLELFLHNADRLVTRNTIANSIWPHTYMTDSALKNLLCELRKKIKYDIIKNVPAQGWVLTTDYTKKGMKKQHRIN